MFSHLILAGDGHGCLSTYKGLQKSFQKIDIITNTKEIFADIRSTDKFVLSPYESSAKVFLSAGYSSIIKEDLLNIKKCLNIHYAVLPRFRGIHPVVWGILDNEKNLGWTLHEMDLYIDSGPIIYQYIVENDFVRTAWSYVIEFDKNIEQNIADILTNYLQGEIQPVKQDHSKAIWGFKRNLDDCKIDFSQNSIFIKNFFRALNTPYPYPFFCIGNQKIFVTSYDIFESQESSLTYGRVANIDSNGVYIRIKDGYLIVKEAIDENKSLYDFRQFLRIGKRL